MPNSMNCPFCKKGFVTASGVVIHLESGSCPSGLNRQKINEEIRRLDRNNVITRPMITMPGYKNVGTIATERSWNGRQYECCLCSREFGTLQALNAHMRSPIHEQAMYRCPKTSCGTNFKLLSSLVQHVESESCGVMKFSKRPLRSLDYNIGTLLDEDVLSFLWFLLLQKIYLRCCEPENTQNAYYFTLGQVQQQAKNGISNMVGRMIDYWQLGIR